MPRAWSIEELRRFEEIRERKQGPKERATATRQRAASPASRDARPSLRRATEPRPEGRPQ